MKPIKIGLYGCGARTHALLDSVYKDNLIAVSCCYDTAEGRRGETAKKYGSVPVTTEEELLKSPDTNAFLISLPPKYHAAAAMKVAETGKPIFLEKPIATTLEDAGNLVRKIAEKKIICHVGLAYRYIPVFNEMLKLVENGLVGKVLDVFYHWVAWAGALPMVINETKEQNWRGDSQTGGQLLYHCCHLFDLLRYIGKISGSGDIISVTGISNHLIFPKSPSENVVISSMEYENGAIAGFHFSEVSRQCDAFGRIEGTESTIEFFWNDNSVIKIYENARRQGPRTPDRVIDIPDAGTKDREIMFDFIKEAKGEQPVKVSAEDGYAALKIPFAIRKSAEEGRKIYLKEIC